MNSRLAQEFAKSSLKKESLKRKKKGFIARFKRGYLRLGKKERGYFILLLLLSFLLVGGILFSIISLFTKTTTDLYAEPLQKSTHINPTKVDFDTPFLGSYKEAFDDINDYHIAIAQRVGIDPERADFSTAEGRQGMLLVNSDSTLKVDKLTHSYPYLIADAYNLLKDIAKDFQRILQYEGIPPHRLIVTSLTRSIEQRKRLERVNANASKNSAHCYGTTFDISWSRFDPLGEQSVSDAVLKKLLASILTQYSNDGRCYIKHERRQACFHITVIPLSFADPSIDESIAMQRLEKNKRQETEKQQRTKYRRRPQGVKGVKAKSRLRSKRRH